MSIDQESGQERVAYEQWLATGEDPLAQALGHVFLGREIPDATTNEIMLTLKFPNLLNYPDLYHFFPILIEDMLIEAETRQEIISEILNSDNSVGELRRVLESFQMFSRDHRFSMDERSPVSADNEAYRIAKEQMEQMGKLTTDDPMLFKALYIKALKRSMNELIPLILYWGNRS